MYEYQFFHGLNLSQRLFAISDNLSKTLQKELVFVLSGLHLAEVTFQTFQKCNQMKKLRNLLIILLSTRLR